MLKVRRTRMNTSMLHQRLENITAPCNHAGGRSMPFDAHVGILVVYEANDGCS